MKKLFTVVCVVSGLFILAQSDQSFGGQKLMEDLWFRTVFNENANDIQGSPYHNSKFNPAKLVGTEEFLAARYNILHDNVEFIKEGKIMVVPRSEIYKSFRFPLTNEKIDLINDSYYFNLHEGKTYSAYKKIKVKFQKFERATSGYVDDKPAKFIKLPDTYYVLINNQLIDIPKNQKAFAALFPQKKDAIIKFLKENKSKLNNEGDIKMVMKFIEEN